MLSQTKTSPFTHDGVHSLDFGETCWDSTSVPLLPFHTAVITADTEKNNIVVVVVLLTLALLPDFLSAVG